MENDAASLYLEPYHEILRTISRVYSGPPLWLVGAAGERRSGESSRSLRSLPDGAGPSGETEKTARSRRADATGRLRVHATRGISIAVQTSLLFPRTRNALGHGGRRVFGSGRHRPPRRVLLASAGPGGSLGIPPPGNQSSRRPHPGGIPRPCRRRRCRSPDSAKTIGRHRGKSTEEIQPDSERYQHPAP